MDLVAPSEHLCYVRCTFCNTVLALQVGVPCKRLMDTVTVKCGHCNNLSYLSLRPPMVQPPSPTDHPLGPFQVEPPELNQTSILSLSCSICCCIFSGEALPSARFQ